MQSEASKPVKLMFRPRDFTRHHKQTKIASICIYIVIENGATFQNWSEAICILLPFGVKWEKIKTSHAG